MNWQKKITAFLLLCALIGACDTSPKEQQDSSRSAPAVVTADIQKGIEKHIEQQARLGGGYFRLGFGDK